MTPSREGLINPLDPGQTPIDYGATHFGVYDIQGAMAFLKVATDNGLPTRQAAQNLVDWYNYENATDAISVSSFLQSQATQPQVVTVVPDPVQAFADRFGVTKDLAIAAGAGAAVAVVAAGAAGIVAHEIRVHHKRHGSKKRHAKGSRKGGRKLKFGSPAWRKKYGKRKGRAAVPAAKVRGSQAEYQRKGGGKVRYTKKGQPFVIGSDGKSRFLKRSKRSKK